MHEVYSSHRDKHNNDLNYTSACYKLAGLGFATCPLNDD